MRLRHPAQYRDFGRSTGKSVIALETDSDRLPFVSGLIAAVHHSDGSRELMSDLSGALELKVQSPGNTQVSELPRERIPQVLADRFALPGFELGTDGRVR
jgi:hypothetical protein